MTIGEQASELAGQMSKKGVAGVYILEFALLELLEVKPGSVFLKLSTDTLLHDTDGYARLKEFDAEQLRRIQELIGVQQEIFRALAGPEAKAEVEKQLSQGEVE